MRMLLDVLLALLRSYLPVVFTAVAMLVLSRSVRVAVIDGAGAAVRWMVVRLCVLLA